MENENNNSNKDIANSLSKYSDYANKSTNLVLDSANAINKWYSEQLDKITESDIKSNRLETSIDNSTDEIENTTIQPQTKLETKVESYDELQTNNSNDIQKIVNTNNIRIKTQILDNESIENADNIETTNNLENNIDNTSNKHSKIPKRIATTIKGAKIISNTTNKVIKTGKNINTGLNEGGLKSFEHTSNRIMTKPVKKVANKVTHKATNLVAEGTKKSC